jgi:hypothetical protein
LRARHFGTGSAFKGFIENTTHQNKTAKNTNWEKQETKR